jgi:hypothetical protein
VTAWTEYQVGDETTLEDVLGAVGYQACDPKLLDAVWDLAENAAKRDSTRQKYDVQRGDRFVLPLPDIPAIAVAPSPDAPTPSTFVSSEVAGGDVAFQQRLVRFDGLLLLNQRPIDAYRSSFAPVLLQRESEVMLVVGAVSANRGDDDAEAFVNWLLDSKLVSDQLVSDVDDDSDAPVPVEGDEVKTAARVWARYPGQLSAFMAYFLRGSYIQKVKALLDPSWAQMKEDELTRHLQSKMSRDEVEAAFKDMSAERKVIKTRVRGYGYLLAIVLALIWARDDIVKGDWDAVARKVGGLLVGTLLVNMMLYARDPTAVAIMRRNPARLGKWFQGAARTNARVNAVVRGPWLYALSLVTEDSPEAQAPLLPRTDAEADEIAKVRLELGIPSAAYVDRHGHAKKKSYLQVELGPDIGHGEDEFDQETDEILWWLGVDITYHWGETRWTVPGRKWW